MQNIFGSVFLAVAFVLAALIAFVVFLSLRGSGPEERADILRALADFSAAFVGAMLIALALYRGPRRLPRGFLGQPPDHGTDDDGGPESES